MNAYRNWINSSRTGATFPMGRLPRKKMWNSSNSLARRGPTSKLCHTCRTGISTCVRCAPPMLTTTCGPRLLLAVLAVLCRPRKLHEGATPAKKGPCAAGKEQKQHTVDCQPIPIADKRVPSNNPPPLRAGAANINTNVSSFT